MFVVASLLATTYFVAVRPPRPAPKITRGGEHFQKLRGERINSTNAVDFHCGPEGEKRVKKGDLLDGSHLVEVNEKILGNSKFNLEKPEIGILIAEICANRRASIFTLPREMKIEGKINLAGAYSW